MLISGTHQLSTGLRCRDNLAIMTDSPWLTDLKAWAARNADDDDAIEQIALGTQELLASVPDDEIREAYLATSGTPGDPIADILLVAIEQRGIDL